MDYLDSLFMNDNLSALSSTSTVKTCPLQVPDSTGSLGKIKKCKITMNSKQWNQGFTPKQEWPLLTELVERSGGRSGNVDGPTSPTLSLLTTQIGHKLSSYKMQDRKKHKYEPELFISFQQTLELLVKQRLQCSYCFCTCRLLYDNVRDPIQWSLDRLDNGLGHNFNNVCMSCLSCNLKRRITQYRHFLYTKHAVLSKLETGFESNLRHPFENTDNETIIPCKGKIITGSRDQTMGIQINKLQ